jgi:DNA mismatch repair protein MSH3
VDELDSDDSTNFASGAFPSLMCIVEADSDGSRKPVKMGMVTVVPSTGDVIYDTFEDGPLRLELETRLSHLRPHELLVKQNGLTSQSSSILKHFTRGG